MIAERRFFKAEVRATDGEAPQIVGYGAKFNVRSLDLGGFVEIIKPGAFDECLASGPDIVGMWNHDDRQIPLGRTTSGTMKVSVDEVGLRYEIDPPDTQIARDLVVSIRRKDINASSFGFVCLQEDWSIDRETDTLIRAIEKAEVFDCSPVIFPAYPDADAGLRSLFSGAPEMRSVGRACDELRSKIATIRQQLAQGDRDALDDQEFRRNFALHLQLAHHLML